MSRLAWGLAFGLLVGNPGWAIDILSCGEMVPAGDVGVLQADLTCSGVGVEVDEMATLQLNGHSITGASPGVFCTHRCTIQGPGEIVASTSVGIETSTNPSPRLVVEDVTVRDGLGSAIVLAQPGNIELTDVTVSNNLAGVSATNKGRIRGTNVMVAGNSGIGLSARRLRFTALTLQGNGAPGLLSFRGGARLVDSTLSGNNSGMGDLDLATRRRPGVLNTPCGRSARVPDPPVVPVPTDASWGVCTND